MCTGCDSMSLDIEYRHLDDILDPNHIYTHIFSRSHQDPWASVWLCVNKEYNSSVIDSPSHIDHPTRWLSSLLMKHGGNW